MSSKDAFAAIIVVLLGLIGYWVFGGAGAVAGVIIALVFSNSLFRRIVGSGS